MNTIVINSKDSGTSRAHVLILNLTNEVDLKRGGKLLRYQILVFITHGKTKNSYNNKKFKISAPT